MHDAEIGAAALLAAGGALEGGRRAVKRRRGARSADLFARCTRACFEQDQHEAEHPHAYSRAQRRRAIEDRVVGALERERLPADRAAARALIVEVDHG